MAIGRDYLGSAPVFSQGNESDGRRRDKHTELAMDFSQQALLPELEGQQFLPRIEIQARQGDTLLYRATRFKVKEGDDHPLFKWCFYRQCKYLRSFPLKKINGSRRFSKGGKDFL